MKSFVIKTLTAALFFTAAYTDAFAVTAVYNPQSDTVIIDGAGSGYSLAAVMPYEMKGESLNADTINDTQNLIYWVDKADNFTIPLSDKITDGKYLVHLHGGEDADFAVIKINTESIKNILSVLNGKNDKNAVKNVLKENVPLQNVDFEFIADGLILEKPSSGYGNQDFIKAFTGYEGADMCINGKIKFSDFINEYSGCIDSELSEKWKNTAAEIKEKAESCTGILKTGKKKLAAGCNDVITLAEMKNAKTITDLSELCIKYFKENNVNMSVYNNITSEYYRDNVWRELKNKMMRIENMQTLEDEFNAAAENAAKEANKKQPITGGGGGSGSGGSSSKNTNMTLGIGNSEKAEESKYIFSDLSGHWALENIEAAYKRGIINGYDDGAFRPDKEVTRAEFVKMMTQLMGIDGQLTEKFSDVKADSWYGKAIGAAVNAGWVNGISENEFAPEKSITREEGTAIIFRACKVPENESGKSFADESEISDYALKAVKSLSSAELLQGDENNCFNPSKNLTRAEAATLMIRLKDGGMS